MSKVKLCNSCKQNRKDDDIWGSGYVSWIADNNYICPLCQGKLEDTVLNGEEDEILLNISRSASFFDAMVELKEKDPIEFQLKISQFRTQVEQQNTFKKAEEQQSVPHCPHCNSTKIAKISGTERAVSIIGLGIFSKKINKSFKCKNCGYTW